MKNKRNERILPSNEIPTDTALNPIAITAGKKSNNDPHAESQEQDSFSFENNE